MYINKAAKATIESSNKHVADLARLFSRIYEDNIIGKLSDERYTRMASEYESKQKHLIFIVDENEQQLTEIQQKTVNLKILPY